MAITKPAGTWTYEDLVSLPESKPEAPARHRLRAFQISSHGHFRAHSGVTIGDVVLAPTGAWISITSSISKPFARSRRIQSP